MNLLISGGRVVDPANKIDAILDVYVHRGKIAALGEKPENFTADQRIDATGLMVFPGLLDLCARLREPGEEHKASIASETRAAASGGITPNGMPARHLSGHRHAGHGTDDPGSRGRMRFHQGSSARRTDH